MRKTQNQRTISEDELRIADRRSPFFEDEFNDPTLRLPPDGRTVLQEIEAEIEASIAAGKFVYESERDLSVTRARVRNLIRDLEYAGKGGTASHIVEVERVAVLNKKIDECQKKRADLSEERAPITKLRMRLRVYLEEKLKGITPRPHEPPVQVALNRSESPAAALEATRAAIARANETIATAKSAPISTTAAKLRLRDQIEGLAAPLDVTGVIELGRELTFPWRGRRGDFVRAQEPERIDFLGLLIWAARDQILEKLDKLVDQEGSDDDALDDDERAELIRSAKAERLALERREEALVRLARESGLVVQRRGDADPRAVLGLADELPEARE